MEVDQGDESTVSVHPVRDGIQMNRRILTRFPQLAIMNMSDQYTRITCGGSKLKKTDPVVGLLFGVHDEKRITILNSDDIAIGKDKEEAANTQISLHQAVFPLHTVRGWYRVSNKDVEPNQEDLEMTVQLASRYSPDSTFLFTLLRAPADEESKDEKDDEFPFALFQIDDNALVAVEDWAMETSQPERLALEHVMRQQPREKQTEREQESKFCDATEEIQFSLEVIQEHMGVIRQFLQDTENKKIPVNHALIRRVKFLTTQLQPVSIEPPRSNENLSKIVQQLTLLTRTTDSLKNYTTKFRSVHCRSDPRRSVLD